MRRSCALILAVLSVLLSSSCRRDHSVDPSPPQQLDGRQKFVGVYDVYDTLGVFQYSMEISLHPGTTIDSLYIHNWGDAFDVYCQQDAGNYSDRLNFGLYFGIVDYDGHHWALYEEYDETFQQSLLRNDTLHMAYLKNNIAFYVDDGVPYFNRSYREYGVKRDWE